MNNISKKLLSAVAIFTASISSHALTPTGPCADGSCGDPVWELKNDASHMIRINDNHEQRVVCNDGYSSWDQSNKKFTLLNRGLDGTRAKTCFATTNNMKQLLNMDNFIDEIPHGYMQAKLKFSASGGSTIGARPAFWLDGTDEQHQWPNGGEIDIAEQYRDKNYTHLIGKSTACDGKPGECYFERENMQTVQKFAPYPNNMPITYGLEWKFNNQDKALKLCTWQDNVIVNSNAEYTDHNSKGCTTISKYDSRYHNALQSVYNGFTRGNMRLIFDVDSMPYTDKGLRSSLTISDVAIFQVP
ncbi:MAG: hypothetical protein K0R14_626 [Burkholderiales bacterium]|jgi:hypothetical protein|nr:hypothetical protein [Burkholderiales bacterium]